MYFSQKFLEFKQMQAIILAAGLGRRLKEYTQNNAKCMAEVNGTKLIDRVFGQLRKLRIVIFSVVR